MSEFKLHHPLPSALWYMLLLLLLGCKGKESNQPQATKSRAAIAMKPMILEIVDRDSFIDTRELKRALQKILGAVDTIYQWKNHYVLFDTIPVAEKVRSAIAKELPAVDVRIYDQPFYTFDRTLCNSKSDAKEWDHILLTANLVEDTNLQKEYMDHHATQFREWPEVSTGFCRAGFQQLLVYRNGRQLMLVISIPKGESLDRLNPKTTEHNPRVDEWNSLMKRYQEGIPGTAGSETWVFLKPVFFNQTSN